MKSCFRRQLLVLLALALCGVPGLGAAVSADTAVAVVASGLTNPRGFAIDDRGQIAVAIAGKTGPTAGVAVIGDDGCPVMTVEGLPSYRVAFGGPAGVADVALLDGALYFLFAGGNIDAGGMVNGLYRVEEDGGIALVADISRFIRDNSVAERPGDYDTDGQPYAMLAMGDAFWVTEGNSNQVLRLGLDGTVSRIADLSAGHPIPTGIAPAPDGGVYVAMFTSVPYREGAAYVIEVDAEGAVSDVWSGLTLVTALASGPDGSLYALEMATGIDPDDPGSIDRGSGRVVRQTGPASAEPVVTGLPLPVAMSFGPEGALYVAGPAFGADNGEGSILRVDIDTDIDQVAGTPIAVPESLSAATSCP